MGETAEDVVMLQQSALWISGLQLLSDVVRLKKT